MKAFCIGFLFFLTPLASQGESNQLPSVIIHGTESRTLNPLDPFSVFKVEKVSKKKLKEPQRQSLSELLEDQVGVDSQVYCANCGAKRLTINGLKGEHTSILVDGLPLHSAVSSFYGVDNIPINGLSEVLVLRGAGASLTNPEAIGGTINLLTVDPLSAPNTYSVSSGLNDTLSIQSQNHNLLYNLKSSNKRWGLSVGGQFSRMETWDQDENQVSEMPQRENYSFLAKTRFLLGGHSDFSLRWTRASMNLLGGYWKPEKPEPESVSQPSAQEQDFVGGDINNKFIGDPSQITDWIHTRRNELALQALHYLKKITVDWKVGLSQQSQESIYQHGFDYNNLDEIWVGDLKATWGPSPKHIFIWGGFFKSEKLQSTSAVLFDKYPDSDPRDIPKDTFNFSSLSFYGQYDFLPWTSLEFNLALRWDRLSMNWLELSNFIEEDILAPRIQVLYRITPHLTQRISYGLGYRAPLTFFESQHGNNERGYEMDITDLEKAHSLVYSLSLNQPNSYITLGTHYTHLENMAFGQSSSNRPIIYKNSRESYSIWVVDLLMGYKPNPHWFLELSLETFKYPKGYKRNLVTAAIEDRLQFRSSFTRKPLDISVLFNLVGSRDLSQYASYMDHFQIRNQRFEPDLDPKLPRKKQRSPTYFTLDTHLSYEFSHSLSLQVGVENIFNFTQTQAQDSPATWHWHSGHSHFDNFHTWGPNTGRQYLLNLRGNL